MKNPTFRPYLTATLTMFIAGWAGLYSLVNFTLPTLGPRWAFFFLAVLALTGTALPVIYFINRRFNVKNFPAANIIIRQALWVGVYGATLAWMQLGRVATLNLAAGMAFGFVLMEVLIRMREKAQWTPPEIEND